MGTLEHCNLIRQCRHHSNCVQVYLCILKCFCVFSSFVDDKFATKKGCAVIFGQKCTSLVSSGSAAHHLSYR